MRYASPSCWRTNSRWASSDSERSRVITPASCPVITSWPRDDRNSKATPRCSSMLRSTTGRPRSSELREQPPLGRLGVGEGLDGIDLEVVGPHRCQPTARAQRLDVVDRHQPVAASDAQIGAAAELSWRAVGGAQRWRVCRQGHQTVLLGEKPERRPTGETARVVEEEQLPAHRAPKGLHGCGRYRSWAHRGATSTSTVSVLSSASV